MLRSELIDFLQHIGSLNEKEEGETDNGSYIGIYLKDKETSIDTYLEVNINDITAWETCMYIDDGESQYLIPYEQTTLITTNY